MRRIRVKLKDITYPRKLQCTNNPQVTKWHPETVENLE